MTLQINNSLHDRIMIKIPRRSVLSGITLRTIPIPPVIKYLGDLHLLTHIIALLFGLKLLHVLTFETKPILSSSNSNTSILSFWTARFLTISMLTAIYFGCFRWFDFLFFTWTPDYFRRIWSGSLKILRDCIWDFLYFWNSSLFSRSKEDNRG